MSKEGYRYRCLYDDDRREKLFKWWAGLKNNNASRARLKRCKTPAEAMLISDAIRVGSVLGKYCSAQAKASVAGLLAHIKTGETSNKSFGCMLASPVSKGGNSPYSELRFRQLITSKSWDEFYRNMRRAITVLGGNVNPMVVADVVLCWDKERSKSKLKEPGKSLVFELSNDYYLNAK